jgi:hypothetical protein
LLETSNIDLIDRMNPDSPVCFILVQILHAF